MNIKEELFRHQDKKYRDFQAKLIPNIDSNTIIGVRTPDVRSLAKKMIKEDNYKSFLEALPHTYYEENLLHFFIVSLIKDFNECIKETERFLPYVDCWPVSDQATPITFKKNHDKLLSYIKKWIKSKHIYTARFGIRMLMNEFLDDDFKEEYLLLVASIKSDDYYLKMMISWFFATSLAKQYDKTIIYLENKKLDKWIHNKTISKAIESYRITNSQKEYLKKLKRKD